MTTQKQIIVDCQSINQFGYGVAEYNHERIFVPGLLPGERAEIIIDKTTKNYTLAHIHSRLTTSENRVTPRCQHVNLCGGCELQHMDESLQLKCKQDQAENAINYPLSHTKLNFAPIVKSPNAFEYRNKMTFFLKRNEHGEIEPCMYQRNSKQLTPIQYCHLHYPLLNQLMLQIVALMNQQNVRLFNDETDAGVIKHVILRANCDQNAAQVVLVTQKETPQTKTVLTDIATLPHVIGAIENIQPQNNALLLGKRTMLHAGQRYLNDRLTDSLHVKIPATAFYQVNHAQMQQLYDCVFQLANITPDDIVIDYYCGIGAMTLRAAQNTAHVIGVDIVDDAIRVAKQNAKFNKLDHVQFFASDVDKFMQKMASTLKNNSIALIDPPRKGCSATFLAKLIQTNPKKIIYVSCNPHTLGRDLAILIDAGYAAETIHFFDMFPQTMHIESVVLLTKKE